MHDEASMNPSAPLELSRVIKRYERRAVLDGLDLSIPAGSVVGLLGKPQNKLARKLRRSCLN